MELFDFLQKVVEVFENLEIPYVVTGSVASMAYGEPRLTNDIDIVADIVEEQIPKIVAAFPADEFYLNKQAIREAIGHRNQFNIIHPGSGLKVDIILKQDTPFDNSRFGRARRIHPAESYQASFAAPEDVIIKKMEYYKEGGSDKHLRDITGILKISGEELDREYIAGWAQRLGLSEIWDTIVKRVEEDL